MTRLFGIVNRHYSIDVRKYSRFLRISCFKKLLDTGKTLRYIGSGDAAGMERSHRKLRTGLAY
ncbi:hypothetical protein SDC9_194264 [bioreactor metagenome]|uniref:Uncharacterized protein n=1 Tax=bioreactor metagenome TaxID=1076179 RepID=A0A645I5Z0_9ZZZZ